VHLNWLQELEPVTQRKYLSLFALTVFCLGGVRKQSCLIVCKIRYQRHESNSTSAIWFSVEEREGGYKIHPWFGSFCKRAAAQRASGRGSRQAFLQKVAWKLPRQFPEPTHPRYWAAKSCYPASAAQNLVRCAMGFKDLVVLFVKLGGFMKVKASGASRISM